ncbi:hypothetical protein V8C35DRAFT_249350 [Trichoderma chlorosporum]
MRLLVACAPVIFGAARLFPSGSGDMRCQQIHLHAGTLNFVLLVACCLLPLSAVALFALDCFTRLTKCPVLQGILCFQLAYLGNESMPAVGIGRRRD